MKSVSTPALVFSALILLSTRAPAQTLQPAQTQAAPIISCSTQMESMNDGMAGVIVKTDYQIFSDKARFAQTIKGQTVSDGVDHQITISEGAISPKILALAKAEVKADAENQPADDSAEIEKLNTIEQLINHAMTMELLSAKWPDHRMSTGVDITQIASAKAYQIDYKAGEIGSVAIIEAKDASGAVLGTFLGGFLVSPCK